MRTMQICLMGLLLSVVAAAQSNEFYGAQLIPQWSSSGELQVEATNWSKLPLSVERLTVELPLQGGPPCRLSYEQRLELPPTGTRILTIADSNTVRECLTAPSLVAPGPRVLRFVRPLTNVDTTQASERGIAPEASTITMEAALQVDGRAMRSQSRWFVEVEGQ